jgi:hypothetical protein
MASWRRGLAALLILVLAMAWAGCSGGGSSIDDSQIIAALKLKQSSSGYEMKGDPFCRIDEILNDVDEVKSAARKKGSDFVIAAPKGEAGVVARAPFAPACKRQAQTELKQLVEPPKKEQ